MNNALREAFLAAGKDIEERRTGSGSAFFTAGHAIGQLESRATALRARLWLVDKERQKLEARPTFDADSGWLHVVSDEDVAFLRILIGVAHRSAASGNAAAAPPAPRPAAQPWAVLPEPAERRKVTAPADPALEKKKGAVRRPPTKL